jgi:hypothetical protein
MELQEAVFYKGQLQGGRTRVLKKYNRLWKDHIETWDKIIYIFSG